MKLISSIITIASLQSCSAFTSPARFGVVSSNGGTNLGMAEQKNIPFFALGQKKPPAKKDPPTESDNEFEEMVQAELNKNKRMSNLRNANGVDYAPWMGISEEDENEIRQIMKEKKAARDKRREQEKSVSGNLYLDSQAQELSGTGLKSKVISGDVELEWATKTETNCKGFVVKRRPAKTEDFVEIASYKTWGPLLSKGPDGGIYRFLDTDVTPGGWVYRVSECDNNDKQSDLCQCLVDVQTQEEQRAGLIAGVGIGIIVIGAVVAGLVLDPYAV